MKGRNSINLPSSLGAEGRISPELASGNGNVSFMWGSDSSFCASITEKVNIHYV